MRVHQLWTRDVATVNRSTTLLEAARLMRDRHVGDLVVVDRENGRPLGILTDRDIVVGAVADDPSRIASLPVGELLARTLVVATQDEEVGEVLFRMQRHGVRRIPVVDPEGKLAGIVTLDDVLVGIAAELASVASLVKAQPRIEIEQRS